MSMFLRREKITTLVEDASAETPDIIRIGAAKQPYNIQFGSEDQCDRAAMRRRIAAGIF
jgi:hypothetical protein